MSKELEAWKTLKKRYMEMVDRYAEKGIVYDQPYKGFDALEKYVTPPTQEEVCEALSERFDSDVIFDGEAFVLNHGDNSIAYCYKSLGDTIKINYALPPHLITLIGRFYEGLEKIEVK